MQHPGYWTCDMHGGRFEHHKSVRNDVTIVNGDDSRLYGDVCDPCIKKLVAIIDEAFPKNTIAMKAKAEEPAAVGV
jgi:hypothetical protein